MKTLTYASLVLLAGAALGLVADTASACPAPSSGTGLATCPGGASMPVPDTTSGPVCWNTLCPGVHDEPTEGTCNEVWVGGEAVTREACTPVISQ